MITAGLADFDQPLTPYQRRALFAAARARGLDHQELRALTPTGSIARLTIRQAAALLDSLNRGTDHERSGRPRRPRRPRGILAMASGAQLAKIEGLRERLGWTREGLTAFLATRHYDHGDPMTAIVSGRDAQEIILLLSDVADRTDNAKRRRAVADCPASKGQPTAAQGDPKRDSTEARTAVDATA
jgi:hypothetical protein